VDPVNFSRDCCAVMSVVVLTLRVIDENTATVLVFAEYGYTLTLVCFLLLNLINVVCLCVRPSLCNFEVIYSLDYFDDYTDSLRCSDSRVRQPSSRESSPKVCVV